MPLAAALFTPILPTATRTPHPTATRAGSLVIHNAPRTVTGGRKKACDLKGNRKGVLEPGCEVVSILWLPHVKVVFTLTYPDGTNQTFRATSDARGNALHIFNVPYVPSKQTKHGQPGTVARISIIGMNKNGTWTAPETLRFAVIR
jgi:hypothetical protein